MNSFLKAKRYSKGRFIIRPGLERAVQVEEYISRLEFLRVDERHRVHTRNKQHRVYSFHLDAAGKDVMMKVFWLSPQYPLLRRIDVWFSRFLRDRCRKAFFGALELENAGINTFKPLAYWSCRKSPFYAEKYLLYERIPAAFSIREYKNRMRDKMTEEQEKVVNVLIEKMADTVAEMHRKNLKHGDIASCNFLVTVQSQGGELKFSQVLSDCRISVIDTDRVCRRNISFFFLKRVIDLKSLKPLDLDTDDERRVFLKKYLGADYSNFWWRVFDFWWRGDYRLFRRAYHWLFSLASK